MADEKPQTLPAPPPPPGDPAWDNAVDRASNLNSKWAKKGRPNRVQPRKEGGKIVWDVVSPTPLKSNIDIDAYEAEMNRS